MALLPPDARLALGRLLMWPGLILGVAGVASFFWEPLGDGVLWLSEKAFVGPENGEGFLSFLGSLGRVLPILAGMIIYGIGSSLHEGVGEVRGKIKRK